MDTPTTQTLRFRTPASAKPAPQLTKDAGILQYRTPISRRKLWTPSYSMAVRMLLLVRVAGAMYSNIQDCDEVFNFWEPLHLADRGTGFQTWEVSPKFAIRSWAYILLHLVPARIVAFSLGYEKRPVFFAIRIALGVVSVFCEARLYRAVVEKVNERVGRYLLFLLLTGAGMWNAATAFLPSSFAMYTTMLAFASALEAPSLKNGRRTYITVLVFATGAIVGWPFALALAIPFTIEELFIQGVDRVAPHARLSWMAHRWKRLILAGASASLLFIPVFGTDSLVYGRFVMTPWNIVRYNIFGGSARGPELYGTSPWNYYLLNLMLNFNIIVPLALLSLPALAVTYAVDRKPLLAKSALDLTSPFVVLAIRLAPVYIWLGILSAQAHKEERFMFPIYPLLCFNGAMTLYLVRGWLEAAFISITKSPYKASRSSIFRTFTSSIIIGFALLSLARIVALWTYYHAPLTIFYAFETQELPRLLNESGLLPPIPRDASNDDLPRIDLSPIKNMDLRLCLAKEWHRFPGHYLVPDGVRVDFVKSDFDGALPGHFQVSSLENSEGWWLARAMSQQPEGLNDLNREESSHYASISTCDYLIDLDFPLHPVSSALEPRYAIDEQTWERAFCMPFLDARHSALLTRTLWLPGKTWQTMNEYGDYCLLRNRERVGKKVKELAAGIGGQ